MVQNDRLFYLQPEPDGTTALRCLLPDIGKDFLISLITCLWMASRSSFRKSQCVSDLMLLDGFR